MADRDVQFRYNSEQVKAHQATTDPVVSVDTRRGEVVGQFANAGPRPSLVTADAGSPNSYRTRAWKTEVATLSVATGLEITVCHFPPGTSKWNKIEHMLFSHITMNWRGRPLASHEVIVASIAATTTRTGLPALRRRLPAGSEAGRLRRAVTEE